MQCHEEQGGFFLKKKKLLTYVLFWKKYIYCNFTHNKEYNHPHLSY